MRKHNLAQVGFTMVALSVLMSFPVVGADVLPDLTK